MRQETYRQPMGILCIVTILAVWVPGTSTLFAAAEDITGDWQITVDFNGRPMLNTLSLSKKADGALEGTWGWSPISKVKFQDGKLTFVRTVQFGDQEFTLDYAATLKDGKLTGTLSSDQGDMSANGVRKKIKSPVLGQWDIKFSVMDREIAPRLVITEKSDGTLACQWTKEEGQHVVPNVRFQDGKLTLTRKSKIQDMDEFETTYEATVKGNDITGVLKGEMGDFPANGRRVGAALIGKWDLTSTSDFGTFQSRLTVDGDMAGTYDGFGGEIPAKDLKLDGDQLTFKLEMPFGDDTIYLDFKGKLDGKTLKGQMNSDRGTSEVTGKKVEVTPAVAAPAPAAAKTATAGLVGTWELTSEGRDGTPRTNTLKINADMTGTYTGRNSETPIQDIKVEGSQVTFKYTRSFNDQEFTMEFKGKLEGATLNGEFVSERGNRPVTGKKVN